MRVVLCSLLVLALSACVSAVSPNPRSTALEDLVLCVPPARNAPGGADIINDQHYFDRDPKNPNYYVPTQAVTAFGFAVRYAGLRGVMYQPGPNLTLAATVQQVRQSLSAYDFTCKGQACMHRTSPQTAVLIYPHGRDRDLTTIQCAYTGP